MKVACIRYCDTERAARIEYNEMRRGKGPKASRSSQGQCRYLLPRDSMQYTARECKYHGAWEEVVVLFIQQTF